MILKCRLCGRDARPIGLRRRGLLRRRWLHYRCERSHRFWVPYREPARQYHDNKIIPIDIVACWHPADDEERAMCERGSKLVTWDGVDRYGAYSCPRHGTFHVCVWNPSERCEKTQRFRAYPHRTFYGTTYDPASIGRVGRGRNGVL